jgi:dihydrolipoamide dehydrogenase
VNRADARLLGACMVAPRGENLAHLIAWCLEQGLTVTRMLSMPFYHPTIEEALQGALRDAVGKLEDDLDLPDHPLDIRPL